MKRVLIVLLIAIFVLVACNYDEAVPQDAQSINTTEDGIQYSLIYIEGMPCIWVFSDVADHYYSTYAGLDCDWSKHPSNLSQ
jgi:predicted small secreted protein